MAALKVFSGSSIAEGKQFRVLVAATSRAAVVSALADLGIYETASGIAKYWSVTHNQRDIAMASARPGVVFREVRPWSGEYVEYVKVERA